jgi:hypothetical protein
VSEKTDTFAFGVVLLELLTGKPAVNEETNEFLYSEMQEVLQQVVAPQPLSVSVSFISSSSPVMRLLPLLDAAAGGDVKRDRQLRKRVTTLALITAKCVEMFARKRCTVSEVLPELDALAGREAVVRAGRGEEHDPMTGKLRGTTGVTTACPDFNAMASTKTI